MNCDACASILDLFSEHRLTTKWAARVTAHLERCPSCAAREKALRPAAPATLSAPAFFKERLRRAAAGESAPSAPIAAAPRMPTALWALAVVVLFLLVLNAAVPGPLSQKPASPVSAAWRLQ